MNNSKYKELKKNTILFTISSIGTKLISFLLVPLYTYALSTNDYGTADLMSTTVSLLLPIISVNVQDAVLRFSLDKDNKPEDVISIASKVILLGSFLLGGVVLLLHSIDFINIGGEYWVFLWVSYTAHALFNSLQMYLKARDKVTVIVVASIISTIVCCLLNIILLLKFNMGVIGYLIATASASVVSVIICLFGGRTYRDISLKYKNKKLLKQMLVYCSPLIVNSLAWWINSASDRYIITYFKGPSANGVYSVSYKIPTILSTVQTIFYNAWSVSAIKEFDKDDKDGFIGNIYTLYSCMSLVTCSVIMLFNPYIARFLYAKDFYDAWKYVPALLVATVFNGLALVEGCLFTAVKKTKIVSTTTLAGAIINTILNFLLIFSLGVQGAAIATMLGYFTVWVIRTILLKRDVVSMKVNWTTQCVAMIIIIVQCIFATLGANYLIQLILVLVVMAVMRESVVKIIDSLILKYFKK